MNKKIETQKIKVNNGQELITKAKEYKNSGGEWKLRERYMEQLGWVDPRKEQLKWGIIISNGEKTVNICSVGSNGLIGSGILDETKVREQLHEIFPEVANGLFAGSDPEHDQYGGRPVQSRLDFGTCKQVKEADGNFELYRYLVAENSWHLKQILHQYVRENETKIYQSPNPHFSDWVEIIDGQDGNMYLYVGEKDIKKNVNGGREIKIGIKKEEFGKDEYGGYSAEEMLSMSWNLFTIDRLRKPSETHEYYSSTGGLEEEWNRNWPHRQGLCRKYLEELRDRMTSKANYWKEKARQKEYLDHEANEQIVLAWGHVAEINELLNDMEKNRPAYYAACDKDCAVCGVKLCCHYEGQACSENKNRLSSDKELAHYYGFTSEPGKIQENKNNQLKDSEKSQILQYFIAKNISKISLENGKLIIEYGKGNKEIIENENQELQNYHQIIKKLPNQSLSLTELQTNSYPNSGNNNLYQSLAVGGVIGAVILVGFVLILVIRKKSSRKAN